MRVKRLFSPVISIALIVLAFGAGIVLTRGGTQTANAVALCSDALPDEIGMHYEPAPLVPALISIDQAIQIAKENASINVSSTSTLVKAQYVLFSDNSRGRAATIGDDDSIILDYQNVPAWVVTFCGLSIAPITRAGGTHNLNMNYAHEWNVAVNAQTGEYMEEFSFR